MLISRFECLLSLTHPSGGGVSLKPGDGIIHSWLNRMLLPDTVGTGGDSHTRFPIGRGSHSSTVRLNLRDF